MGIYKLFDLDKDPGEVRNVFGETEYAEAQAELAGLLERKSEELSEYHGNRPEDDPYWVLSESLKKQLEKLRNDDLKISRKAAHEISRKLVTRYESLNRKAKRLDPELLEEIRSVALTKAMDVMPRRGSNIDLQDTASPSPRRQRPVLPRLG